VPLRLACGIIRDMPKDSKEPDTDKETSGGGIIGAVTQDIELTVEQAEEAAKKAAHAAAVALGIASDEGPAVPTSSEDSSGTAEPRAPSEPSKSKPDA